ncbi:MAG: sporulation initiation factor Spo0A [Oscillospiraceae bacterium]|nr:sporulation initiation factor Spo0A [Oscillospiraceae bacterium]
MQKRKLQKVLQKIARDNNTTPEIVYHEIQLAIDAARNNPDPAVRSKWESIPKKGETPTVEEFLEFMVLILKLSGY